MNTYALQLLRTFMETFEIHADFIRTEIVGNMGSRKCELAYMYYLVLHFTLPLWRELYQIEFLEINQVHVI